jgi:hypothetical protein
MVTIAQGKGNGGGTPFSAAAQIKNATPEEVGKQLELLLRPNYYLKEKENK